MDSEIKTWLSDIQTAIIEIESFFDDQPKNFKSFNQDVRTKRAVERNIEIIGEAMNRILKKDHQFTLSNSRKIVDSRNRIIHGYDSVSDEMLWGIIVRHLPILKTEVENLLTLPKTNIPMSTIKACLFDLDGVIVDTAVYHYKAWKRLAAELGFDFTEHDNERLKGVSRMRSLEIILEIGHVTKTEAEMEELATRKNNWYVEMINQMTPAEVLPGAKEFLEACRAAGIKTALGSASKNSGIILNKTNIAHLFDAIIDGNKVSKAKPDPEVFLKGAEALNEPAENCVVFEDAIAGVEAAINGHMKVVGIGLPDVLKGANLVVSGLDKMTIERLENL